MWLKALSKRWLGRPATSRQVRPQAARPRGLRPVVERLEERTLLSNYTAATVSDLINDITAANTAGGSNTITLVASTTFQLTVVDNTTDGATGLPIIAKNDHLTIVGQGDTIERSTASGTPAFRLLDVASGARLTLKNLTLQDGLALGAGVSAEGGAIFNRGRLTLSGVTVQSNSAQGSAFTFSNPAGRDAAGGGIYSAAGALTLTGNTKVQFNKAVGGQGASQFHTGQGGKGSGGGLFVAGGTVTLTSATLSANAALGGSAGNNSDTGGNGRGGGLFVSHGTVTLASVTLSSNTAQGGQADFGGQASGGGLFVAGGMLALKSSTVVRFNLAQGADGLARSGAGSGGGLYVAGGTVRVTGASLFANTAVGGSYSAKAGNGLGGGLYVAHGTVTLTGATLASNRAAGGDAGPANVRTGTGGNGFGGGLYEAGGMVTLSGATVSGNTAQGGPGGRGGVLRTTFGRRSGQPGGMGGNGFGGGLYVAGGSLTLGSTTLSANSALGGTGGTGGNGSRGGAGGNGGNGGNGFGGGLYVAAGTVTLTNDTATSNSALAGTGGSGGSGTPHGSSGSAGSGEGGGLYLVTGSTVCLDAFTQAHVTNNTATDPSGDNIVGTYSTC
jgi:hypothetical protein